MNRTKKFLLAGVALLVLGIALMTAGILFHKPNCSDNYEILGSYYVDVGVQGVDIVLDENGIPRVRYGGEIGIQYNPVTIGLYALDHYERYLRTQDNNSKELFIKQANWLEQHLVLHRAKGKTFGVWEYSFDYEPYQLRAPWVASMAQGVGISVLLRAYYMTCSREYLVAAMAALEAFRVPVEAGGILYQDQEGFTWYEEYPSNPPSHVLNGFIFSLFGLYDFYRATGNEEALILFNEGIKTLEANLYRYDTGFWSTYDLWEYSGSRSYTFRLVTNKPHPADRHPIDALAITAVSDGKEQVVNFLDVGTPGDDDIVKDSYLYYAPEEDWGDSYVLEGRSVRDYADYQGIWAQAPFEFRLSIDPSSQYFLLITYKDVSNEPIYLEIFSGKYFRLGRLEGLNDGLWKTNRFLIPRDLLIRQMATEPYHRLHIEQLRVLYKITGKSIFKQFAERFELYLRASGEGR